MATRHEHGTSNLINTMDRTTEMDKTNVNRMGVDRQGGCSGDEASPRSDADAIALRKSHDLSPIVIMPRG